MGVVKKVPVIRSYATLGTLNAKGSYYDSTVAPWPYLECEKLSAIHTPGPAEAWVFIEPNELNHDAASFDFIISEAPNFAHWAHLPADRHAQSCNLSFVDGHVQPYRWKAPKEKRPGADPIRAGADRQDFNRLIAGVPRKD
jgi:prepilin-type processing-associated H-X9-DG protein